MLIRFLTRRAVWLCAVAAALLAICPLAAAHPPVATSAIVKVESGGDVSISLNHDVLAFALNDTSQNIPDPPMLDLLNGSDASLAKALGECATRFEKLCALSADGVRVPIAVTFYPTPKDVREARDKRPTYPLPIKLDLLAHATIPTSTRTISIRFPEMLGTIVLVIDRPGEEPLALPLEPNELSPMFDVALHAPAPAASPGAGGDTSPDHTANNTADHTASPTTPVAPSPDAATDISAQQPNHASESHSSGLWGAIVRFTVLGFTHIIPSGPDHALFVLGLFLLSPRPRPVILQISSFTVAHTLTLTLTSIHIIGMPSSIVEPTIAASIAFVGIENLLTKDVHAWRSAVAFLFGLVHGMGVATAFNEAGFPPGQLVSSLAAFTIGVEAGHLSILAAAFLLLGWTTGRPWYRARVAIPLSLLISLIALVWLVQRIAR